MSKTKIEWATHTANDQAGCTKVSRACENCYAIPMSIRIANMNGSERYTEATTGDLSAPEWSGVVTCDLDARARNFRSIRGASKPRRTFYGSMTDIWHESLAIDGPELTALAQEIVRMPTCKVPQVVMFLTKRPTRLRSWQDIFFPDGLPRGVWVGTTVEEQNNIGRATTLLDVNADVRFLSCEPLFEHIELGDRLGKNRINWLIAGGMSGPNAVPSYPDWFRSLRDMAEDAGVPFLFKQWGEWAPSWSYKTIRISDEMVRVGKHEAGNVLDGRQHLDFPKVP